MKKKQCLIFKERVMSTLYAETINNVVHYFAPDYEYVLTDEKFHKYQFIVIQPKHIKLIKNQTNLDDQQLKERIVEEDFRIENDMAREHRNKKARERREK